MDFYYRKDTGFMWPKHGEPTEREQRHLAGASGLVPWGMVRVALPEMQAHVLSGHCVYADGSIRMLPENEWPENQGDD